MRSSKSRSRNKNRNNRPSGGNIVNRVFDSSGPDGKVRGTPQQIIDKYSQLHRDAQLSGDRVAAENYAQHAEHYLRLLSEAQAEIERVRAEQEEANRQRQAERDRERAERLKAQEEAAAGGEAPGMTEADDETGHGLVETPESRSEAAPEAAVSAPPPKPRRPRKPKATVKPAPEVTSEAAEQSGPEAAE